MNAEERANELKRLFSNVGDMNNCIMWLQVRIPALRESHNEFWLRQAFDEFEKDRWFDVYEKQPEDYDEVIVRYSNGKVTSDEFIEGQGFVSEKHSGLTVTHWTYFPEFRP